MDKYNRRLHYFFKMGFFAHHNGRTEFLYFLKRLFHCYNTLFHRNEWGKNGGLQLSIAK
jgi:hypothetical protein